MNTNKTIYSIIVFTVLSILAIGLSGFKINKKSFVITDYGAIGNGQFLNTDVLQKLINNVHSKGGGTIVIPEGEFLTGAIYLKQGTNLHLEKNAIIKGSADTAHYPPVDRRIEGQIKPGWCPALINGYGLKNLRITGEGTIQGGGKPFWDHYLINRKNNENHKNLDSYRPQNIFLQDCKNVLISGIKLRESGFWNLHLYRCSKVKIENIDIRSPRKAPSTDGIDIDSSQDVEIIGCYISVDDDCIALKGTKGPDAKDDKSSPPVERIRIRNCTFNLGYGALTFGSEGTIMRNIIMENCTIQGDKLNTLLRFKVRTDTPQTYENIIVRNIYIDGHYTLIDLAGWSQYKNLKGMLDPWHYIRNITMENITGTVAHFASINPPKFTEVSNITLRNIHVKTLSPNFKTLIKDVSGLKIENCTVNGVDATGLINVDLMKDVKDKYDPEKGWNGYFPDSN